MQLSTCKPCECTQAGWCNRHKKNKTARQVRACKQHEQYRHNLDAWQQGGSLILCDSVVVRVEPRQCQPGCQLTRLLARLSIEKQGGCPCEDFAHQMDAWGVSGCKERVGEIVEHLRQQATERSLPFNRRAATWLVKLAIKLAAQQREPSAWERGLLAVGAKLR